MNSYKKIMALAVMTLGLFAFYSATTKTKNLTLDLTDLNVVELISKQQLECRPSSDFMFFVETELVSKARGASTVNAKIFILEKSTGRSNVLISENLEIQKFEDTMSFDNVENALTLRNGDKILEGLTTSDYNFKELLEFETIYNGYIKSTNQLLNMKRAM